MSRLDREQIYRYRTASASDRPLVSFEAVHLDTKPVATARGSVTNYGEYIV